jgi:hypothetical protein
MRKLLRNLIAPVLILALSGCTAKKRDTALPYGEDKDLLEISAFDNKEFDVQTSGIQAQSAQKNSQVQIKDESGDLIFLNFVEYKTSAALMDNAPFRGQPNKNYKVRYVLENGALKVYKVGEPTDFSVEEKRSSVKLKDGKMAAPVISYSVSYFTLDNIRNDFNEATNKLRLVPEQDRSNATHFKIDINSKTLAEYLQKDLVFRSDYFNGEWYFAASIVSQNAESKSDGLEGIVESGMREKATKVKAKKDENQMSFYGTAEDPQIKSDLDKKEVNQANYLAIPAEFIDFRLAPQGRGTSVKEEEFKDRAWDQRSYIKLDLGKLKMDMSMFGITDDSLLSGELRDVQIGTDQVSGRKYFSFTVLNKMSKSLVRYSLLQAIPRKDVGPYEPKVYNREDQTVFGYFATTANLLKTIDRNNKAFFENSTFVRRFNPKFKSITFHPTENSPDWTLPMLKDAVSGWNRAFAQAGLSTTIEWDAKKVAIGDIRYNTINVIDDPDGNNPWGGFGPNLSDPETGEVIASSANLNLGNMVQASRLFVRRYLRAQLDDNSIDYFINLVSDKGSTTAQSVKGLFAGAVKVAPRAAFLPKLPKESENVDLGRTNIVFSPRSTRGYQWAAIPASAKKSAVFKASATRYSQQAMETPYSSVLPNLDEEIRTKDGCKEIADYVSKAKSSGKRMSPTDENSLVDTCAHAIMYDRFVAVIMHEMGHNLGLRHNFYGSIDKANFWTDNKSFTSSVMEYTTFDRDGMPRGDGIPKLGTYDIAAIKWGYSDQLFALDMKSSIKTDPKIPLKKQQAWTQARFFKYCSDENALDSAGPENVFDPLCARQDEGTTALETAKYHIKTFNYALENALKIESGALVDTDMAKQQSDMRDHDRLMPLASIYQHYRMMIEEVLPNKGYLENETVESFPKTLADVESRLNSQGKLQEFQDYRAASELIYQFFKSLAFMPDYYCVGEFKNDPLMAIKFIPFSTVQRQVYEMKKITIQTCKDPKVGTYFDGMQGKFLFDVGYPLASLSRDLDLRNDTETPAALGTIYDRANAIVRLGSREPLLRRNLETGFLPNFFDEPQHRVDLEKTIISRIVDGLDVQSLNSKDLSVSSLSSIKIPKFENEKPLLNLMFEMMMRGSNIPGKPVINSTRMTRYMIEYAYSPEQLKQPGAKQFTYNGRTFFALPKSEVVYQLIDKADFTLKLKQAKLPSADVLDKVKTYLLAHAPAASDKSVTVNTMVGLIQDLSAMAESDAVIRDNIAYVKTVLAPELKIISEQIVPDLSSQLEKIDDPNQQQAKEKEYLSQNFAELAKRLKIDWTLTKETVDGRIKKSVDDLQKQIDLYKAYESDIDAQADILLESIMAGGGN